MSAAAEILGRMPNRPVQLVSIKCATTSPFTVYVNGGATAVPARKISGHTFSVNDVGSALWQPPAAPICFKTTS